MEANTENLMQKLESVHLLEILTLEKMSFPESFWNEQQILSHLQSQKAIGCFLKRDNFAPKLIHYILYLENDWEIEILRIATHKDFRRKNYAIQSLEELFQKNLTKTFFLEVESSNKNAIDLYRKLGFQLVDKRKAYYENGNDAYLFVRQGISP